MPAIAATETTETAPFWGKRYVRKQFNVSQRQQQTVELPYRGVRYSH